MKKILTITTLLAVTCAVSLAQDKKLKDVQEGSLWAPAGVKADGKLVEWNDSFQAYNKATKLYYTISNDEKNIYLAIKSTDAMNNNKIVAGAITIAINTEGKKKTENTYKITYPVIAPITFQRGGAGGIAGGPAGGGGAISVIRIGGGPGGPAGAGGAGGAGGMRGMMGGMSGGPMDSATIATRKKALLTYKEIKVSGFKDIPDSLISLYNEHGVKTMANYDNEGNFLYEVAIPLKLMGLTPASTNELAYNVKLNGLQIPSLGNIDMMGGGGLGGGGADPGGPGGGPAGGTVNIRMNGGGGFAGAGGGGPRGGGAFNFQEMISPSDFWGKYVLAKK
jgi:hypothetical protein